MVRADLGTLIVAAAPTAVMRPPSTRTVWSGCGGRPVASMTVTWVIASREDGCAEEKGVTTRRISRRGRSIFLDFKGTLTFRATGHF